jgi:L-threonylcarbamoyladenylate synthase
MTLDSRFLDEAVKLLHLGELVAFPTETVYGLGAHAALPEAVAKIFAAKGRPADHPLIVHLPSVDWITQWATDIPPLAWDLAVAFWPGPLTLILKKQAWVPALVTGGQESVGLRVPRHPVALELLKAFAHASGRPGRGGIAAPSANRFGRVSPTTAAHVREELGDRVAMILEGGPCQIGIESTIVDFSRGAPEILRPGHLGLAQLGKILGTLPSSRPNGEMPRVSGSLASHYAPEAPTHLLDGAQLQDFLNERRQVHCRCGVLAYTLPSSPESFHFWRVISRDALIYARDLYAMLRELDRQHPDLIVVETPPDTPAWAAVLDRLRRAAFSGNEG